MTRDLGKLPERQKTKALGLPVCSRKVGFDTQRGELIDFCEQPGLDLC